MKAEESRREFLQSVSLAGAALMAGGAVLAAAGCKKKESPTPLVEETCKDEHGNEHKKVCAWIDENGCLFIEDQDVYTKLNQDLQSQINAGKSRDASRAGVCVSWPDPGSPGSKVNSLCNC